MARYYFLASLLPPLYPDRHPDISWGEFLDLAQQNLTERDWRRLSRFRTWYDLLNLRSVWDNSPLLPYGELDVEGLRSALATQSELPELVWDWMSGTRSDEERHRSLPQLLMSYLGQESHQPGFLGWFAEWERQQRLLLAALRALGKQVDLQEALRGEDPAEPFVAALLRQRGSPRLHPPAGWDAWVRAWEAHAHQPMRLASTLLTLEEAEIQERWRASLFTVDYVLSYAARLIAVLQLRALPEVEGRQQIHLWLSAAPSR